MLGNRVVFPMQITDSCKHNIARFNKLLEILAMEDLQCE